MRLKNFYFLTKKLKPVELGKVACITRVSCQKLAMILSYLDDSFSVSFLNEGNGFDCQVILHFSDKCLVTASKKCQLFNSKLKPLEKCKVAYVTKARCQYLAGILSYIEDSSLGIILKRKQRF